MAQSDREPLVSYEQAIRRLVWRKCEAKASIEQMELAVQIVADVFWLSDAKVRHDLEKGVTQIDASFAQRRRRGRFASGMIWGA